MSEVRRGMIWLTLAVVLTAGAWGQEMGRSLEEFGDIGTPEAAAEALERGVQELLGAGGGVLVIPQNAPEKLQIENNWQDHRSTHDEGPVVTIVDYRRGFTTYYVAPIGRHDAGDWSGFRIMRHLNLGEQSLPHCGAHSAQSIHNYVVSGSTSYMATLTDPLQAGTDVRCYVDNIRGIWVGAYLNVTSSVMGYAEPLDRTVVKSIGWDPERGRNFFTMDLEHDHPAGALVYNKHIVNGLDVRGYSNADNQTPGELSVRRYNYAVGDSFAISGIFYYMGDVFSGFGDEGGIVLNAETVGELDSFASRAEAVDWSQDQIKYEAGIANPHTLSNSRPLINMNEDKWITQGHVLIVSPTGTYQGSSYPGVIGGPGNAFNYQGGLILGSADCQWNESIIGRFFAVTDDTEVILPGDPSSCGGYGKPPKRKVHRWYQIMDLQGNEDGTKVIKILRVRWSAVAAGAPKLFLDDNYTWDDHERPLSYAIAPGAWVYDISEGFAPTHITGGRVEESHPRLIKVVPSGDRGTPFDFEVGDEIEQAVGPDPWQPRPLRIRQFDQMPSTMPSASIEVQQLGRVQVPYGLHLSGIISDSSGLERRKDGRPPYDTVMCIDSMANTGIEFKGEIADSAIMFRQPRDTRQIMRWRNNTVGSSSLSVHPVTGDFELTGGNVDLTNRGMMRTSGISATETPAANLRGMDVAVAEGATELQVRFSRPEQSPAYAVAVTPSWLSSYAVPAKTAEGFTVQFGDPAPQNARLDWIIMR